jgi:hypothetical protein
MNNKRVGAKVGARVAVLADLTQDQKEFLINYVKINPSLWDLTNISYHLRDKTDMLWRRLANQLIIELPGVTAVTGKYLVIQLK